MNAAIFLIIIAILIGLATIGIWPTIGLCVIAYVIFYLVSLVYMDK